MTELAPQRRARRPEDDATAPFSLERTSSRPPAMDAPGEESSVGGAAEHVERSAEHVERAVERAGHGPHQGLEDALDDHDGVVHLVSRRSDPSGRVSIEPPRDWAHEPAPVEDHAPEEPSVLDAPPADHGIAGDGIAHDETPGAAASVDHSAARRSEPDTRRLDRAGVRATRFLTTALAVDALVLLTLASMTLARLRYEAAGAPDLLVGLVALVLALPCLLGAISLFRMARRGSSATTDAHRFAQGIGHLRAIFVIKATVLFATLGLGCFAFSLVASLLAVL